jgi:hypothetical protein
MDKIWSPVCQTLESLLESGVLVGVQAGHVVAEGADGHGGPSEEKTYVQQKSRLFNCRHFFIIKKGRQAGLGSEPGIF